MAATAVVIGRKRGLRGFWASLDLEQRRTLLMMAAVVSGLHLVGFGILYALSVAQHDQLGSAGAFTLGIGVTAYTLGMRHAFDADHIAAIDNTTRKLMAEGRRPLSVGFWFSLGHSTIVFGLAFVLSVGVSSLAGPVRNDGSGVHHDRRAGSGRWSRARFSTRSPAINVVILFGIIKVFREMKSGRYDELELERAAREPRADEPLPRPADQDGHQAAADVPDRRAVRPRLRHRDRGRAARARRRRRRVPACPGTRSSASRSCSPPGCRCWTRSTGRS